MRKISADYIFPISTIPLKDGVVITDDEGKILSVDERKNFDPAELEIYHGIICPGFINAHCHLELSYMKGKIPEKKGLVQFIIDLIDYRNGFTLADESDEYVDVIYNEIRNAEIEMKNNGIVAVGDISNDDFTFSTKAQSSLRYHTFIECFGFFQNKVSEYFNRTIEVFHKVRQLRLPASITPHAPYSVHPELFQMIFSFKENRPAIFSYHNQESKEENTLFGKGSGDFLKLYDHFKIPPPSFVSTGNSSLESVIHYFPTDKKTLFVHNTFSDAKDISLITTQIPNAFFCFCPNANKYIENLLPDFGLFKNSADRLCIGTDSYASNHQLSILDELKTIQRQDASISMSELLQWGTLNGARFFSWDDQLGSIEPGKKPGLNLIGGLGKPLHFTTDTTVQKLI